MSAVLFLKLGLCENLVSARVHAEGQKILSLGIASSSVTSCNIFSKMLKQQTGRINLCVGVGRVGIVFMTSR